MGLLLSVGFSLFFTLGGLLLAFMGRLPVGFYITMLSSLTYFSALVYSRWRTPPRVKSAEPCRGCVGRKERAAVLS
jgi:hypothetical protein